uniref:Transcription factor IIIB 50 kDa subunit n=1 Tax=Xenopus tropicalis TaxID=8364 RepID=A0A6I8RHF8_XENTR
MSGAKQCPDCGSSDIVEDAHYSQDQVVCADCGCILSEGLITTTAAEESHLQAVRFADSTGENDSMTVSKLRGIVRVRNICRVLRLPDGFSDTAVSYYEQAYKHPLYHSVSIEKKEIIVGCCVYITCRQHQWPITMATICSLVYAKKELFASIFLSIVQVLKLDVPSVSLQNLVMSHCRSFKLFKDSCEVPSHYAEKLDTVSERTVQTVELAYETWLVTGRHPIPIITAAAYISWQSLLPARRLSCSLSRFCKLSDVDLPPPSAIRLRELQGTLIKLSVYLPWLKVLSLNKKTVVQHLGDLLRHRVFLLRKALAVTEAELSRGTLADTEAQLSRGTLADTEAQLSRGTLADTEAQLSRGTLADTEAQLSRGTLADTEAQLSRGTLADTEAQLSRGTLADTEAQLSRGTLADTEAQLSRGTLADTEAQLSRGTLADTEAQLSRGTKALSSNDQRNSTFVFLPPCVSNPRKRSRSIPFPRGHLDITGDEDISDSEIEQYLRTPAEMKEFEQALNRDDELPNA